MTDDLPIYVICAVVFVALVCAVTLFLQTWWMIP